MAKAKKRGRSALIVIYLLILIALFAVIFVVPRVTGAMTGTEIIQYGDLIISDEVTCYLIRDEKIYTAKDNIATSYPVEEGTLVKAGSRVVDEEIVEVEEPDVEEGGEQPVSSYMTLINGFDDTLAKDDHGFARRKGVLSFHVDGKEEYFSTKNMTHMDREEVEAMKITPKDLKRETVYKGEPVFKISSNSQWYITFWIEKASISRYETGKKLSVQLGDEKIDCRITNILQAGDYWQVICSTNRYYSGFATDRRVDGQVITTDVSGILISNGCITTKDGEVGVYRKNTAGEFTFVPVKVLASDGKVTAVAMGFYYDSEGQMVNTVQVYDEVLTDPEADPLRTETKETPEEGEGEEAPAEDGGSQ